MDNVEEVIAEEVIVDPPVPAEDEEEELDEDDDEDDEDEDPEDEEDEVENPAQVAHENAANENGEGVDEENAPNPNEDNDDGVIDGGLVAEIAHFTADERRSSAFMKLHLELNEELPVSMVPPNHPIYTPGVVISIGLKKDTKLESVFKRYCEFANNYYKKNPESEEGHDKSSDHHPLNISFEQLEFSHCSILERNDTAETSALMKNDRISVRREQTHIRKAKAEDIKAQRDSDRTYFKQLRKLLPDSGSSLKCDVFFHCKGKITDEHGYKQEVLTTFVRGHSAMISKRCPWLAKKIQEARHCRENLYHAVVHIPESDASQVVEDQPDDQPQAIENPNVAVARIISNNDEAGDDDDDDDSILVYHQNHNDDSAAARIPDPDDSQHNHANAVEDDEDDNNRIAFQERTGDGDSLFRPNAVPIDEAGVNLRPASPIPYLGGALSDALEVPLLHPPEAVKLLLEYCYTNRVNSLGQEAFVKAFKEVDQHSVHKLFRSYTGPVGPYKSRSWPNHGRPTISLAVALAGIQLAEEANLPRLSLMCEIAASLLLKEQSILESLAFCEQQYRRTDNRLPHLKKAIMLQHVLGRGKKGVDRLASMASFQRTLNDRRDVVVPSLMHGIMRTVKDTLGETKQDNDATKDHWLERHDFEDLDASESKKRELERVKRRKERWSKRPRRSKERNPYHLEDIVEDAASRRTNRMLVLEDGMELLESLDLGDRVRVHGPAILGVNDFGRYEASVALGGRRWRKRHARR